MEKCRQLSKMVDQLNEQGGPNKFEYELRITDDQEVLVLKAKNCSVHGWWTVVWPENWMSP